MKKCSICGIMYDGYGHNAQPINDGRCCNSCNELVTTRRLNDAIYERKESKENGTKENK